jgi:hypothetical protein
MKQIKDLPELLSASNSDKLLVQDSNNLTKYITKANLLTGLSSGGNSNDFNILGISSLTSYWDADNVVSSSGEISQLTDRKGNYNATQPTNNLRPTLVSNVINGKPIIRFAGTQYLTHLNLTEPATIITVVRNTGSTTHRTLLGALSSVVNALDAYYFKVNDTSGLLSYSRSGLSANPSSPTITTADRFFIQSARYDGSKIELFINKTLVSSVVVTGTAYSINTNGIIGAGYYNNAIADYFIGDLYAACLFSSAISNDDLLNSIGYFKKLLDI